MPSSSGICAYVYPLFFFFLVCLPHLILLSLANVVTVNRTKIERSHPLQKCLCRPLLKRESPVNDHQRTGASMNVTRFTSPPIYWKKRDAHFWTSCFLLLLLGGPRLGGDGPMRKPGRHPIDNLTWTCLIRNRKKKGSRGSGNTWRRRRLRSTWTKGQQQRCLHIRWPLPWQQHHSLKKKKKIFYLIFFFLRSIRWSVPSGQDFDLTPHQLSNVDVQFL